jgi:hypothetical protein
VIERSEDPSYPLAVIERSEDPSYPLAVIERSEDHSCFQVHGPADRADEKGPDARRRRATTEA